MSGTICLAADHGGFQLKAHLIQYLEAQGYTIKDLGTHEPEVSVDYPDYARKMARAVLSEAGRLGILICGTGIGMSIAANRYQGVRAALCHDEYTAKMARQHNNANVLVLGGRVLSPDCAEKIVSVWLKEDYEGGRHDRRLAGIENLAQDA
jgi:ribose 5-phosphate isomerase B